MPLFAAALGLLVPIVCAAGLLPALPLVAIVVPLLLGHFPGEDVIERLAARPAGRHQHHRRRAVSRPRPIAVRTLLRTRLLIAASFATRPPPALLPVS